jgi:Protein of unknown function (DUF2897)
MGLRILRIILVIAFIIGGLIALRSTVRTGMPDAKTLKKAQDRARAARDQEDDDR